jgi:myo-inositol-1(or 4)-monophosphatase
MSQRAGAAPDPGELRQVILEAAVAAGDVLRASFGRVQHLRFKGAVDLVTEVDERAERTIVDLIRTRYPEHRILAEEGSVGGGDERFRWIIDPIDGTSNFAHGLPFFCVSIGLEQDGQLMLGAIYDPLRDELFLAQEGRGATLNGRRLAVTENEVLLHALVATGFPYDRTLLPRAMRFFATFSERTRAVRRLGSAALDAAYVAAGRLDCYWEAVVHPWDVAAGALLVREAGGRVTSLSGGPFSVEGGEILATNGHLHDAMLEVLGEVDRLAD